MPIEISDDGVVTVVLANGEILVLPEVVTALKLDLHDEATFHQYDSDSVVGFLSQEDWNNRYGAHVGRPFNMGPMTYENVYKALRHVPAPENLVSATHIGGKAVSTGDVIKVAVLGDVTHVLFPEHGVLINVTLPSHKLHPGIVVRQVVETSGIYSIVTEGVGNGPLGHWNERLAKRTWSSDDVQFSATGGVDTRLMLVLKAFDGGIVPDVIERDPETGAYRDGRPNASSADPDKEKLEEQSGLDFPPPAADRLGPGMETFAATGDGMTAPMGLPLESGTSLSAGIPDGSVPAGPSAAQVVRLSGNGGAPLPRTSSFDRYRQLGRSLEEEASALADYSTLYRESFVDMNGDPDAAGLLAIDRFARDWGLSSHTPDAEGTVLKFPLENVYPALRETGHDYVREDAEAQLERQGIGAVRWYLSPNDKTGSDWRRGGVDEQGLGPRMTLS
ncbi:hypothetical protein [Roseibium sediminicola]|uniref:Uncharacterized protein n=1 Tax=Roseibium sediminicola TaxID=2933272 RepID=A0ABT0GVX5_9HYPH|nr:hypothetical protein [Roseibium sp. CAU 1639]MCK7613598.1 hypothetical protein [Roseibium sp. CAU 1639]